VTRDYYPGIGEAVANRTINRPGEKWSDVARRVAAGNASLAAHHWSEAAHLEELIAAGTILMSGRHLQHGDENQKGRPFEVFSNCSTSSMRSLTFLLLLSGSGVGSSYDDDLMLVDWRKMPVVVCTIDPRHKDASKAYMSLADARHLFRDCNIIEHRVDDSREGWARAIELIEVQTWYGDKRDSVIILDFSDVRPSGSPIKGMQNRPASGPGPLMDAILQVSRVRDAGLPPWLAAMHIDHLLAQCVLVGGARRAARIAVKSWRDRDIIRFIKVKQPGGHLWSANNSIAVDQEFWTDVAARRGRAWKIFQAARETAYLSGEPGFLNVDKLDEPYAPTLPGSGRYALSEGGGYLAEDLALALARKPHKNIVNPCGEIRLSANGGFCVIADCVPYHAISFEHAASAVRMATRALMRVNLMESLYDEEVKRTNRIGVGLTGIHEWARAHYGLGWHDLLAEGEDFIPGTRLKAPAPLALPFWETVRKLSQVAHEEAESYAEVLGVAPPMTVTTIKPAGTTSKLFGLTEGAHLPAMREYLRWVQFRDDDPLVAEYAAKGYPTKKLFTYQGTTVVGFPTRPPICELGPVVTAAEATPAEQFRWIGLLETYWLGPKGNQISYTLKYDPKQLSEEEFGAMLEAGVPYVRAVSVMPQIDTSLYEYQPEEPISRERYNELMAHITRVQEEVSREHVECAGGVCPIDFKEAMSA
jgi:ribonucleoside-triphosphate reductase (formate)